MTPTRHLPRTSLQNLLLLSLLAFYPDISTAATIQLPQPLTAQTNLTSSTPTLNATASHYHCSRQAEFFTPTFEGKDCLAAIEKMRRVEETTHKMHLYEFRELPSHHEHPYSTQKMPRKYVSGSCMVELVMMRNPALDGVEGRGLPENYKDADVASYYDIWRQSVKLADTCLLNFGIPGLISTGHFNSIGVFLWAVNSTLAERIPAYEPGDFATAA